MNAHNPADVAAAEAETAAKPAPTFVNAKDRFRVVPLEWPVEYDGKTYDRVTVRRMTSGEILAFTQQPEVKGENPSLPMFDVPQAVIDVLDPDDAENVNKAVHDFLPRAWRQADAPEQA